MLQKIKRENEKGPIMCGSDYRPGQKYMTMLMILPRRGARFCVVLNFSFPKTMTRSPLCVVPTRCILLLFFVILTHLGKRTTVC